MFFLSTSSLNLMNLLLSARLASFTLHSTLCFYGYRFYQNLSPQHVNGKLETTRCRVSGIFMNLRPTLRWIRSESSWENVPREWSDKRDQTVDAISSRKGRIYRKRRIYQNPSYKRDGNIYWRVSFLSVETVFSASSLIYNLMDMTSPL